MNKELTAIQAKAQAILDKQAQAAKKVTDVQKQLDADRQKLEDERGKALVAGDLSGYRSAKEALEELEDRGEILLEQLRLAQASTAVDQDTYNELLEKTRATISVERQKVVTEMRQHFAAVAQSCAHYDEFCSDAEKVLQFLQHKFYKENLIEANGRYNHYREQRIKDLEVEPIFFWRNVKNVINTFNDLDILA